MTQNYRLKGVGHIDRNHKISFTFNGKKYSLTGTDGVIYGFNPIEGPFRLEDTETNLARYNVSVSMFYGEA